ncbi:hypothetical protein [Priestia megaterium]
MTNRKPLSLDLDLILSNKFLVCDFMVEENLRNKIPHTDVNDLKRFFEYVLQKSIQAEILSLILHGDYIKYADKKEKVKIAGPIVDTLKNLSGWDNIVTFSRELTNIAGFKGVFEREIKNFVKMVGEQYLTALEEQNFTDSEKLKEKQESIAEVKEKLKTL